MNIIPMVNREGILRSITAVKISTRIGAEQMVTSVARVTFENEIATKYNA